MDSTCLQRFSLESALNASRIDDTPMPFEERRLRYTSYLDEALEWARKLEKQEPSAAHHLEGTLGELQFFSLPECCMNPDAKKKHTSPLRQNQGHFVTRPGFQSFLRPTWSNGKTVVFFCCLRAKLVLTVRTTPIFKRYSLRKSW